MYGEILKQILSPYLILMDNDYLLVSLDPQEPQTGSMQ